MDENSPATATRWMRPLVQGLLLVTLLALALAWRTYRISDESLWHDEATSVLYLHAPTLADYFKTQTEIDPAIVPVYFAIEYYVFQATGHSVMALRVLSLIFGMLTLLLLYAFGRRLFGHTGGMLAALFGTFSKMMLFQSQEIRMYGLTYLLALAAMYAFYRALTDKKPVWWVLNVVFNCLLANTHLLASTVVAAEGIAFLVLQRRRILPVVWWSLAHAPGYVAVALWAYSIDRSAVDRHLSWILPPSAMKILGCYVYAFPGTKFNLDDHVRYLLFGIPYLHLFGAAFVLACIVFVVKRKSIAVRRDDTGSVAYDRPAAAILISWLLVPVAALTILSYALRPCLSDRYLGYEAFPMFLMVAGCVTAMKTPARRRLAVAFLGLMCVCNAFSFDRPLRANSAAGVRYLESRIAPDDIIVFAGGRCVPAFEYYTTLDRSRFVKSIEYQTGIIEAAETGKTVWVVFTKVSNRITVKIIEDVLEGHNYEIERKEIPGFAPVYVYR